jgi:hypothetical protein
MRMRAVAAFLRIAGLIFAFGATALAAPPPPPPPPAEEMPAEMDGYSTYTVRNLYFAWIAQRMGQAREEALLIAPLPPELAGSYVAQRGPRIRVFNNELAGEHFGYAIRMDQRCIHRNGASSCAWLARWATVADNAAVAFLAAHFEVDRAIAHLREHRIAPDAVRAYGPQSYGLADPMAEPLSHVEVRQATNAACPQIAEAVAIAEERSRALRLSSDPNDSRPPPPPPPHAYLSEVTLPTWYAQSSGETSPVSYAVVTLSGLGDPRVSGLIQAITAPLAACEQLN